MYANAKIISIIAPMPLYLITVKTWEGRVIQGVRQHDNTNIDVVYRIYQEKTLNHFQRVKAFDCYMISRMSTWYAVYRHMLEKQEERRKDRKILGANSVLPMRLVAGIKGPGKYRTKKNESEDHDWGKSKRDRLGEIPLHTSNMKPIEIAAVYGDEYKTLTITQPNGAAGTLHISINRYHQGTISRVNNEWVAHLNQPIELTGDDILILVEMIEAT
jgi:hypothetical protein